MCLAVCHGHMTNITKLLTSQFLMRKSMFVFFSASREQLADGKRVLSGQDMKGSMRGLFQALCSPLFT